MTTIYEPTLACELSDRLGTSRTFARAVIKALRESILDHLQSGSEVRLTKFGAFTRKRVGAKTLTNPQTGAPVHVSEHFAPTWRPAENVRRLLR